MAAALLICAAFDVTAQSVSPSSPPPKPAGDPFAGYSPGGGLPVNRQAPLETSRDVGPRFDFSFDDIPLSEVIRVLKDEYRKKTGEPLNVVVPDHLRELADESLVTMELKQVTVGDLLSVLGLASQREVRRITGWMMGPEPLPQYGMFKTGYRFERLQLDGNGLAYLLMADLPPEDQVAPPVPQFTGRRVPGMTDKARGATPAEAPAKIVRFFQLEPYLERFSVEDITTAIKAGFELSELKPLPTIRFHEETTLLVVAGEAGHLEVVDLVLRELGGARLERYGVRPGQAPSPNPALAAPRNAAPSAKQTLP
ncbi:MAG: hypothetical protein AB7O66_19655 [Limisphaerales bacterium]